MATGMLHWQAEALAEAHRAHPEIDQDGGEYQYEPVPVRDGVGYVVVTFDEYGNADGVYVDPGTIHLAARRAEDAATHQGG